MPETAVFVIGAFTSPNPSPNSANTTATSATGEEAVVNASAIAAPATSSPASDIGSRVPRAPTIRPEIGEPIRIAIPAGMNSSPVRIGEKPFTSCR